MKTNVLLAPFYLVATSLIGIGDTFYLSYYQHLGKLPSCAIGGCEQVLTSLYSKIYGIPLSYIGLVFYLYMFGILVLLLIDPYSKGLRWGVLLYALIGVLSSIHFESIQIFTLHSICMYCAISAVISIILFCLATWHLKTTKSAISYHS